MAVPPKPPAGGSALPSPGCREGPAAGPEESCRSRAAGGKVNRARRRTARSGEGVRRTQGGIRSVDGEAARHAEGEGEARTLVAPEVDRRVDQGGGSREEEPGEDGGRGQPQHPPVR